MFPGVTKSTGGKEYIDSYWMSGHSGIIVNEKLMSVLDKDYRSGNIRNTGKLYQGTAAADKATKEPKRNM